MKDQNIIHNNDFIEIENLIQQVRIRVYKNVNTELINLYWEIGKYISKKIELAQWGDKTIDQLAEYLHNSIPNARGFERRNLYRMRQFYETYKDNEIVPALRTQLNWTQHRTIISRCKSMKEKEFYIRLCIAEKYSTRELDRQIDSGIFERTMLSKTTNTNLSLQTESNRYGIFRDQYVLDFLNLPEKYSETDFQSAIISSLKSFILEIGKDFSFVGQNYRLQVGNSDFFIDLLFFHRGLQCLVAFELKTRKFKPEYLGQLEFYLEALDRDVKKDNENPSIGILLCRDKDEEVVRYALSRSMSPAMISEYQTKLIPKEILRQKLDEFYNLIENKE
ncbi:MAG TPA: PDDEXK nuclease domain-containing protein [Candidatus Cloacimonadota bacterium]|nr:PDDEXK nuclease domain-containing protein [Candidatus Cloacimonadota bacterium]